MLELFKKTGPRCPTDSISSIATFAPGCPVKPFCELPSIFGAGKPLLPHRHYHMDAHDNEFAVDILKLVRRVGRKPAHRHPWSVSAGTAPSMPVPLTVAEPGADGLNDR